MGKTTYPTVPLEREDQYGTFRLMAYAEGYVMARRKGGMPFVLTVEEWNAIRKPGNGPANLSVVEGGD